VNFWKIPRLVSFQPPTKEQKQNASLAKEQIRILLYIRVSSIPVFVSSEAISPETLELQEAEIAPASNCDFTFSLNREKFPSSSN
jgi:hypothetical protein